MQLTLNMPSVSKTPPHHKTPTFVDNMKLPVHGWFRFPAGFSASWVVETLNLLKAERNHLTLLDPFAGVGTTPLACEEAGVTAFGIEAHPFIERVAQTKLLWNQPPQDFLDYASLLVSEAAAVPEPKGPYPPLLLKCYPEDVLMSLYRLHSAVVKHANEGPLSELAWLALSSILRICSPVGTAPWQYVLPNANKARVIRPIQAFKAQATRMAGDMDARQSAGYRASAKVFPGDARDCEPIPDDSIDVVITSPPYANNYDYADATRLEMTFFGDIQGWGQLSSVRRHLVRSCSQHAATDKLDLDATLSDLQHTPIYSELREVCSKLAIERLEHRGKKAYHLMVAAYFVDLYRVWKALRRVSRKNAKVCFVIGDSAPYGVYVPVERWLGELAVHSGFRSYSFEKRRDRNIKWKNRKHRVPLQEGHLWVEG